jgi:hypothetical protein
MAWTPHDVAHLTAKASGEYQRVIQFWEDHPQRRESATGIDTTLEIIDTLTSAPLSWMDSEVTAIIADTHHDVPEWSPSACMPGTSGKIFFETRFMKIPMEKMTGVGHVQVGLDGFSWRVTGQRVRISAWSRAEGQRENFSPVRQYLGLHQIFSLTRDIDGITGAGRRDHYIPGAGVVDEDLVADAAQDLLSVVGATWLLMSQPRIVEESDPAQVAVRIRDRETGRRQKSLVRVSIRTLTQRSASGPGKHRRGQATSRWWVRGHWRQQPWGKNRALRKPIFIAPHTAGATDAEIDSRPQVQVWRK